MKKFVRIKRNNIVSPFLLFVDKNFKWSNEEIISESKKATSVAKMAFLDHGSPIVPIDILPDLENIKPKYLNSLRDEEVLLIYEGGNYTTLLSSDEIVEEKISKYFPIEKDFAILTENDPFDKWRGKLDHVFVNLIHHRILIEKTKCKGVHKMFSFENRLKEEVIDAFQNTPAIICYSSYTSLKWFEFLLECYILSKSKAEIIAHTYHSTIKKFELFEKLADTVDIKMTVIGK